MLKNKKLITSLLLGLIFAIAIFLRFYSLSSVPVGFQVDEANLGYNGYSLLLTGKDDGGHPWPLYVNMFNDFNPTGYHYMTILPIALFGLNEFSTRLPAALFGALTVFAVYFFAFVIFEEVAVSLLCALLVAIVPWSIVFSRVSAETNVALFFVVLGFAFLFRSFKTKKAFNVITSGILLSLSFFIYPAPRVFVPLLFFVFLIFLYTLWSKEINRYRATLLTAFILVSLIAVSLVFSAAGGTGRFNQVSIFTFPETKLVMEEQIREDGISHSQLFITRAFHNKIISYGYTFFNNYLQYFSGQFLFTKGGLPIWFQVPQVGAIYVVEFPFILYGLYQLAVQKKKMYKLLLLWLFVAPITAAITVDDSPNMRRSLIMFPVIEMIAAYGFVRFFRVIRPSFRNLYVAITVTFLAFNFFYFFHQYFTHAQIHKNWYNNEGFGTMIKELKRSYGNVDKIIVTKDAGGIYPLILFYMQYDPRIYQFEGSPKDSAYTGFGKFFFVPQSCPSVNKDDKFPKGKSIYVDNGTCPDNGLLNSRKKTFINREDGTRVFRIIYD